MTDMRVELNALKDELAELSPSDSIFNEPVIEDSNFDSLSFNSSESAALQAMYRATQKALTALRVRIAQVKFSSPPRDDAAGSDTPVPASAVDRGPTAQS
jgi:hypothetical protein